MKPAQTAALPVSPSLDARIPRWPLHQLEARRCPLCRGEHRPSLVRPDGLPVAFCEQCGLWYVAAIPCWEEIRKLYQGYWLSIRPKDLSKSYADRLQSDKTGGKDDLRLNRLAALSGGLEGKRILEVGCGCGEFLVSARHRGASVFGNDVSAEACEFVRELLRIPVYAGELCDSDFVRQFGRMDMVVMSDLIEHPVEPLSTLKSALNVLHAGGLLLIVTPNGGAAQEDAGSARQWVGFRVDLEHLQYLSTATISMLAERYNCQIEHLETFGYPLLEDIERLPKARTGSFELARRAVRFLRKFSNPPEDPRRGAYHLFAILRTHAGRGA